MLPQLILLSTPKVNLTAWVKACDQALGISVLRGVDSHTRKFSEDARFIAALSEDGDPLKALREAVHELNHLHYSFMVLGELELIAEISGKSNLKVSSYPAIDGSRLAIISGSLFDFYTATLEFCADKATFNLRHLFDQILLHFDKLGLSEVWYEKRRKSLPDKTFLPEDKR
jgi:hypothetical protein